jgi:small subunit ribosomal protein S3
VDYAISESHTTYGKIGIKVWIYKGKFGEEIVPLQRSERRGRSERGDRKPRREGARGRGAADAAGRSRSGRPTPGCPVAEKTPETTENS